MTHPKLLPAPDPADASYNSRESDTMTKNYHSGGSRYHPSSSQDLSSPGPDNNNNNKNNNCVANSRNSGTIASGQGAYSRIQHALAAANTTLAGDKQSPSDLTQQSSSYGVNSIVYPNPNPNPNPNPSSGYSNETEISYGERTSIHTYKYMHTYKCIHTYIQTQQCYSVSKNHIYVIDTYTHTHKQITYIQYIKYIHAYIHTYKYIDTYAAL